MTRGTPKTLVTAASKNPCLHRNQLHHVMGTFPQAAQAPHEAKVIRKSRQFALLFLCLEPHQSARLHHGQLAIFTCTSYHRKEEGPKGQGETLSAKGIYLGAIKEEASCLSEGSGGAHVKKKKKGTGGKTRKKGKDTVGRFLGWPRRR